MVSATEKRRDKQEYSLDRIRELAKQGAVSFLSSRVTRHVENYGYTPDDINECLASLKIDNYRESICYQGRTWLDVYLISYTGSSGSTDDLYIKLKLDRDCILVLLASFHPEGAL